MDNCTRLYRIYSTITTMLNDRGYLLSTRQLEPTKDQVCVGTFREDYGDEPSRANMTILVPKKDDPTEQ
eukprot:9471868-Pyramimonas_sp.AAC.2